MSNSATPDTPKERVYWQDKNLSFGNAISNSMDEFFYTFDAKVECSGVIVIQQITHPLSKVTHLLPFRPVAVVDCDSEDFSRLTSSEPHARHFFENLKNNNSSLPAIIISGQYLAPDKKIIISGKTITVWSLTDSSNHIGSLTQWVNIQEKKINEEHFPFGLFDYRFEKYPDYFRTYANQLPFSTTTLLQIVPLGSVVADQTITSDDRNFSSAYVDYRYCGRTGHQRFCNGKPFVGKTDGFMFEREEHNHDMIILTNQLFGNVDLQLNGLPFQDEACKAFRTTVQQTSEYENGVIARTGFFANNPAGAWIRDNGQERRTTHYNGNELPHELGHTYGLPDWAGSLTIDQKSRSYQLNRDITICLPFFKNGLYKRSCMNSGEIDSTDRLFTSFSDWEHAVILQRIKTHPTIDSEIRIDISADGKETTTTTTVILVISGKDMQMFQLNCFIPSRIDQIDSVTDKLCDYIIVDIFDRSGQSTWNKTYNINNGKFSIVALPNQYIDYLGWIKVQRPHVKLNMKYFVRNDAIKLPKAIQYPFPDDICSLNVYEWPQSKIFNHESREEIQRIFEKYFQIVVKLYDSGLLWKNVTLPCIQGVQQKNIFIYNFQNSEVVVDKHIIKPQNFLAVIIKNRWTEIPVPSKQSGRWHTLSLFEMEMLHKNPDSLNTYLKSCDVILFATADCHWYSPISLVVPSLQNIGKIVVFDVKSQYSVTVTHGEQTWIIRQGESIAHKFLNSSYILFNK